MQNWKDLYQQKCKTVDDALALIESGDTIAIPYYGCSPVAFVSNLHKVAMNLHDVTIWSRLMLDNCPVMEDERFQGHVDCYSIFFDTFCRAGQASGRFQYLPGNLSSLGREILATKKPNVYVAAVSPMDENGCFHVSLDAEFAVEFLESAEKVILEVNKRIPQVLGAPAIPLSRADIVYEVQEKLTTPPVLTATKTETAIGEYVASLIKDGDCIQFGIGGIPDVVGKMIADRKDLGIHTEMLSSSMGKLMKSGAVNNARKNINRGKTVASFAWGDEELYEFMADNPQIEMHSCSYTNSPFVIAQNDNVVSVNSALQIDLTGQICSESIGFQQYTGVGGASDFAYGAYLSKGGRGVVAFPTTAKGGTISRIVPSLLPGAAVSISRNIVDYVATEYGLVHLRNMTTRQRAQALISIAHPDFREDLEKEARKYHLL